MNIKHIIAALLLLASPAAAQNITPAPGVASVTGGTVTIPAWTSAGRPTAPHLNDIGRNVDTGNIEVWNGSAWAVSGGGAAPSTPIVAPSAPTNVLIGAPTTTSLPVSWTASATGTAPAYQVQIAACNSGAFVNYGAPTGATTSTISGLTPGVCEAVRVVASNSSGSAASAAARGTTLAAKPGAPILSAGTISDVSVNLVWTIPTGTAPISYQLQDYTGATPNWANVGTVVSSSAAVGGTLNQTITGLTAATGYTFQVVASNSAGATPSSSVAVTTHAAATVAPSAPTGFLTATPTSSGVGTGWNCCATGTPPFSYEVDYQVQGAGSWVIAATGLSAPNYTFSGLAPSTPYNFRVYAKNSAGTSVASATQTFTTAAGASQVAASCAGTQSVSNISAPQSCSVAAGGSLSIAGVVLNDAATQCCGALNITTSAGTTTMSAGGAPITGSGVASWQINDAIGNVNTDLGTLTYTAPATAGSDTLTLQWWAPGASTTPPTISIPITIGSSGGSTPTSGGGGAAGPGLGGDATGVVAARAQDVWKGFGINLHLDNCCNRSDGHSYSDVAGVESAINYIGGVGLLRDYWEADSLNTIGAEVARATGAQFITAISEGAATSGFNADLARMRSFQAACKCVYAYDGANEWDSPYSASTAPNTTGTQRMQAGAADQPTLYSAAQADGVKAIQLSSGVIYPDASSDYRCCGAVNNADFGNGHTYPQSAPEIFGEFNGALDWVDEEANRLTPGKPVIHTEFGWVHSPDTQFGLQTLANEAAYGIEFIFDAWRHGDPAEIWYGLYDDVAGYFGLFDQNNAPYPIAVALHNLSVRLADTASNARTFTPGKLNISFPSLPSGPTSLSGGQFTVMEKADGHTFEVEVANEQDLGSNGTQLTVAPVTQTVNLGFTATTVTEYDPTAGTSAVQTWSNVSTFAFSLPAHPVILEIVHP